MISLEKIAAEQGLDREDVIELLEDFLAYTQTEDLVRLQDAHARSEYGEMRDRAHSIKGAALNLKLSDIAECAKKIEQACETGNIQGVDTLVLELAAYIKALPKQLDQARRA